MKRFFAALILSVVVLGTSAYADLCNNGMRGYEVTIRTNWRSVTRFANGDINQVISSDTTIVSVDTTLVCY